MIYKCSFSRGCRKANSYISTATKNGFSVDLEDYYDSSCKSYYPSGFSCLKEVEMNTVRLLAILAEQGARATFFCIADLVRKLPSLLHNILLERHEIALHGLRHESLRTMSRAEFGTSIRVAKDIIEQMTGSPILGYRAPYGSLSITDSFFLDTLLNLGFLYDSSIFPRFGYQHMMNQSIFILSNGLIEIPLSGASIGCFSIHPIGGGYLRHLPFRWIERCIDRIEKSNNPIILYCHPYELESCFPIIPKNKRFSLNLFAFHLRQYHNRGQKQAVKLKKLLGKRIFVTLIELVRQLQSDSHSRFCRQTAGG